MSRQSILSFILILAACCTNALSHTLIQSQHGVQEASASFKEKKGKYRVDEYQKIIDQLFHVPTPFVSEGAIIHVY